MFRFQLSEQNSANRTRRLVQTIANCILYTQTVVDAQWGIWWMACDGQPVVCSMWWAVCGVQHVVGSLWWAVCGGQSVVE